ncbi:MAG: phosphatase PAP2 family protein, partial [Polyangiales bacterium]
MARFGRLLALALPALVSLFATTPSMAETTQPSSEPPKSEPPKSEPPKSEYRLPWNEQWTRFRVVEYIATPIVGGIAIYRLLWASPPDHPKWTGPILFDKAVRDSLRAGSDTSLQTARKWGDILTVAAILHVTVVDSVIIPLADHGNIDLAWQMTTMNLEAFAASGLVVGILFDVVARARPSYDECQAGTSTDPLCNTGKFASFPGGHTASAFTAAGLECVHHVNLPLYGGGAPDIASCVASLGVATTAGIMRIVGDRHFASDIIIGSMIGFGFGYGLPALLHYHKHPINEVYASADLKVGVTLG